MLHAQREHVLLGFTPASISQVNRPRNRLFRPVGTGPTLGFETAPRGAMLHAQREHVLPGFTPPSISQVNQA